MPQSRRGRREAVCVESHVGTATRTHLILGLYDVAPPRVARIQEAVSKHLPNLAADIAAVTDPSRTIHGALDVSPEHRSESNANRRWKGIFYQRSGALQATRRPRSFGVAANTVKLTDSVPDPMAMLETSCQTAQTRLKPTNLTQSTYTSVADCTRCMKQPHHRGSIMVNDHPTGVVGSTAPFRASISRQKVDL